MRRVVRPGPRVVLPWERAAGMAGTAGQGERAGAVLLLRVGAVLCRAVLLRVL